MGYFCLKCGEIYKENIKNTQIQYNKNNNIEDWIFCPKLKCIGQVIEVDDMFLPIIRLLNNKGYYTEHCCSGHVGTDTYDSYISFDKTIQGLLLIPEGYIEEKDNNKYCIRRNYSDKLNDIDFHLELLNNAIETLNWAKELKNIKPLQLEKLIST